MLGLVVDGVFGRFHLAALCGCHTLNVSYVMLCYVMLCYEQGIKLLGLLLTGSTGQRMASRNGLA